MGERKRSILVPQYIEGFKCIGSACEDSCCVGWRVDIDNETYRKYQKVKDDELVGLFERYINRNRAVGHNDYSYAKIKLLPDLRCPFLDSDSLCKIHLKRGAEYLSNVCATYPRLTNVVNGTLERAATMSCPEVARLALLNPNQMEFDEMEESYNTRNIIKTDLNTRDLKFNNKFQKYFWELRIFIISLVQNRRFRLSERLIILGMFFKKLQEYLDEERIDDIPVLIGAYVNHLETDVFDENINEIPVQYNIQMELLKELADRRFSLGISSKRYIECFTQFITGINYKLEDTMEQNGERYRFAWENYYEPYMKEHEYILENYIVNYIFSTLFPISDEKNIFDTYMVMILHYALIKMMLIGMSEFHKGLTDELVIKLIQSFVKTIEHNQQFIQDITEVLKRNDYNSMTYMAILIKN
ncbi:flagellin lysine-N-methylase [Pseudobacteroides cellulosolvens]|uniref:Lysine-N-methylase n=1 Tax=Pseudobacteroides cellulosolvens ATCC 35603 = DSM 2933 TaxID=398512 RepID=A0A0L6JS05_9FIRM|nr:flagellin lysine-N-methylase [Pseudobacteroides cellulosolvens]KNY28621.1 protein of unknown function UPF0153 [Pseudobacteroides cellulosolvens ATCC 35603 = DSM 2933]